MPKGTPAERVLNKDKRIRVSERDAEVIPGISVGDRTRILSAIKNYETGELALDDARIAIAYTYSLIERIEEEMAHLREQQVELVRVADAVEVTEGFPQLAKDATVAIQKVNNSFTRIKMLGNLSKVAKTLVEQMEKQEKIKESRARQEYISIQKHSAVLSGMLSAFVAAMVEEGVDRPSRVNIFHRFKEFQERYPVIEEDMAMIHKRLFSHPEEQAVEDADYEVIPESTSYEGVKDLIVPPKKVKQ